MGLFRWLKKDGPQSTPSSDGAAMSSGESLDELMAAARANRAGAMESMWTAVFGLPRWHFLAKSDADLVANRIELLCVRMEEKSYLCAFTSEKRATDAGVGRRFGEGFGVMSVAMPGAIATALSYQSQGVAGVIFDEGVGGGAFASMFNLVGLYAARESLGLIEAAARCGVDPAKALQDRYSATQSTQHLRELVAWACGLPAWWVLADPEMRERPRAWADALEGKQTAAIFTSKARASEAAALMKNTSGDGEPLLIECSRPDFAKLVERLRYEHGVDVVVLNMRVPVAAKGLQELFAVNPRKR